MTKLMQDLPLLTNVTGVDVGYEPQAATLSQLRDLARSDMSSVNRSMSLFQHIRKLIGQPRLTGLLRDLQYLIETDEALGARLLAAFLEVATPGARLLPRVLRFHSARRIRLKILANPCQVSSFQKEWLRRLDVLVPQAGAVLTKKGQEVPSESGPGQEHPWPTLRGCLRLLLEQIVSGEGLVGNERSLLVQLLEFEVDAWQERISTLASDVDPFKVTAVVRLLPLLSDADVEVRDLRQLVSWVKAGDDVAAFNHQISRAAEAMDAGELQRFTKTLNDDERLGTLALLWKGVIENPMSVDDLAAASASLLALGRQLHCIGWRDTDPDLPSAIAFIQQYADKQELTCILEPDRRALVDLILRDPKSDDGAGGWPLGAFRLAKDQLVMDLVAPEFSGRPWPNILPSVNDKLPEIVTVSSRTKMDDTAEAEKSPDESAAAIKQLVMNNIQTVSVLLGFLRNAKITSIPGLVAAVATRTRNPQIIETIASSRALHTGFANRDVPFICLRSPCNVSVKTLRKFIHVKYVAKIELKRMAMDKSGMRKEVAREIQRYLDNLA